MTVEANYKTRKSFNAKEENLDRKDETLDKREQQLEKKEDSLVARQQQIEELESKVGELVQKQQTELERISNLTREQAKAIILGKVESEVSHEIAVMVKESEVRAKEEADKKQRDFISCNAEMCS